MIRISIVAILFGLAVSLQIKNRLQLGTQNGIDPALFTFHEIRAKYGCENILIEAIEGEYQGEEVIIYGVTYKGSYYGDYGMRKADVAGEPTISYNGDVHYDAMNIFIKFEPQTVVQISEPWGEFKSETLEMQFKFAVNPENFEGDAECVIDNPSCIETGCNERPCVEKYRNDPTCLDTPQQQYDPADYASFTYPF